MKKAREGAGGAGTEWGQALTRGGLGGLGGGQKARYAPQPSLSLSPLLTRVCSRPTRPLDLGGFASSQPA